MSKFFTKKKKSEGVFLGQPQNLSGVSAKIDYKNLVLLRNFITFQGKIVPRRVSKLSAKQQRYMSRAIKNARIMGLLPFINKQRPLGPKITK